ncbi:hypothetical protein PIB30_030761 [Stylosanthes scabra]|uniref:Uncharacterized protein n=1 Tax=Stylosanthes scabra TaxID=79078 RepID=A0ABU6YCB2_9FABA|nr:hypothetical protein [Stylosanthes scabra]
MTVVIAEGTHPVADSNHRSSIFNHNGIIHKQHRLPCTQTSFSSPNGVNRGNRRQNPLLLILNILPSALKTRATDDNNNNNDFSEIGTEAIEAH